MNAQSEILDFGQQDFILVRADQVKVAAAIARRLKPVPHCVGGPGRERRAPPRGLHAWRALGRFLPAALADRAARNDLNGSTEQTPHTGDGMHDPLPPHMMHTGEAARPGELLTSDGAPAYGAPAFGIPAEDRETDEMRISIPRAAPDWTLVEYVETVPGLSILAVGLTEHLKGRDVLYFRRSGARAAEQQHDFHCYRDRDMRRRVLSHASYPDGIGGQEWWEGVTDGRITEYEPGGLYDGAREATLLSADKIERILGRIGLSTSALFREGATYDAILFSRKPGGVPLI